MSKPLRYRKGLLIGQSGSGNWKEWEIKICLLNDYLNFWLDDDEGLEGKERKNTEAVVKATKTKDGETQQREDKVKDTTTVKGRKRKLSSKRQNYSLLQQDISKLSGSVQQNVLLTGEFWDSTVLLCVLQK